MQLYTEYLLLQIQLLGMEQISGFKGSMRFSFSNTLEFLNHTRSRLRTALKSPLSKYLPLGSIQQCVLLYSRFLPLFFF